jgi:hypothetical protein
MKLNAGEVGNFQLLSLVPRSICKSIGGLFECISSVAFGPSNLNYIGSSGH